MKTVKRNIEGFPSGDFNFYDLESYWEISRISDDVEYKVRKYGDFRIVIVDNFLENPDGFKDFLKKFPGFPNAHRRSMSRPGFSQKFHPELFRHFEYVINENIKQDYNEEKNLNFVWATNIMNSDMKLYRNSEIPHYDTGVSYVMNYWMCDSENDSAISFYEFDGNKRHLRNNLECDKKYNRWVSEYCDDNEIGKWNNFECDNRWKKYYSSKVKYNRAVFYDPYLYHCPSIKPNSYVNDYRYSLVGFGKDATIAY